MANPTPKTEHLEPYQARPLGRENLSSRVHGVRLPKVVDTALMSLGKDKAAWMRRVLTDAAEREGLI